MVKLGKGEENNPVDFINKRRAALERYYICNKKVFHAGVSITLVISGH